MPNSRSKIVCRSCILLFGVCLTACAVHYVGDYNPAVAQMVLCLLKKTDTLFYEIQEAQQDLSSHPNSADVAKSESYSAFKKEWIDVISDADVLQASACAQPNNDLICGIASRTYETLSSCPKAYQERRPPLEFTQQAHMLVQQDLREMLKAEKYKQLEGPQSPVGSSGSGPSK